jgi:SAM-dependent methyltransferase
LGLKILIDTNVLWSIWDHYLYRVTGCDVQPDTQFVDDRITTNLADSTNRSALDKTLLERTFDIILDDGSHYDVHQLMTFQNLWHRVRPGGYYIIEDVTPHSRIHGEFREKIKEFAGEGATMCFSEHKNILIISKIVS